GASESGKSTLVKRLISQPPENVRTSEVYATVFVLQSVPQKYVALIDGDGSQYYQQFKVAEYASSLIILLDHNISDKKIETNIDRIKEHDNFLYQLEAILKKDNKLSSLKYIHFLLNKRDLWENATDVKTLENWFSDVTTRWKNFGFSIDITSTHYSNKFPDDLVTLINLISSKI
ncbi:MAG TPA: GTPase domain-containing protein, partial [Saprospiraceae bacterium]|nr:GTPase domain-containing protein [Saprospiraceae bacterium]